jgi:hypothetical protein
LFSRSYDDLNDKDQAEALIDKIYNALEEDKLLIKEKIFASGK